MARRPPLPPTPTTHKHRRAQAIAALERDGRLTAEALVRAAANPRHPMHDDFEWDDAKAGHKHRVDQARAYIAEVRVLISRSDKVIKAPGYVRDTNAAPRQGYIATSRLRSEREAAQETLVYEMDRLQAQLTRVREIACALELEQEFEAAYSAVTEFSARARRGTHQFTVEDRPTA